jgi:hypothetical protein
MKKTKRKEKERMGKSLLFTILAADEFSLNKAQSFESMSQHFGF